MTTVVRPSAPVAQAQPAPLSSHVRSYWARVRGGEIGALPGVLGIVVLVAGFGLAKPVFLSPANFAILLAQTAIFITVAMGLVFVLLLGEIDLSAGWAAGVSAAVMAVALAKLSLAWYVAIPMALATGAVIGLLLGTLVAKAGIPSFVVTLAGFLAFQGVLLWLVDEGQVILIRDRTVNAINSSGNLPIALGWVLFAVALAGFAAIQIGRTVARARRGISRDPFSVVAYRIGLLALLGGAAVYVLSVDRARTVVSRIIGVPIVVPIVVVLLIVLTFVLKRTRFGLHLYALGGNAEAARRAGLSIDRLKISAFMICSTLAAVGGILQASRSNSVDARLGGANLLLYAVAAAVIGGTSLFGGRGRVLDAVIGGFVVGIIENGMSLLGAKPWQKLVVTGLVLLVAASVDALARRRSLAVGLR
jgi:D-xylose transport system permease protein